MYITKKHLSRRHVLRGVGASVALPFLDAMVPAATAIAQTAAVSKPRLGFFYIPHGAIMRDWTPDTLGADFDFKPILKPFEEFRDKVTVVSGLDNRPAQSSAVHAITPGTWLTCTPPRRSHAPYVGVSADQIAVQHIGQDTAIPSIEVSTEEKAAPLPVMVPMVVLLVPLFRGVIQPRRYRWNSAPRNFLPNSLARAGPMPSAHRLPATT